MHFGSSSINWWGVLRELVCVLCFFLFAQRSWHHALNVIAFVFGFVGVVSGSQSSTLGGLRVGVADWFRNRVGKYFCVLIVVL